MKQVLVRGRTGDGKKSPNVAIVGVQKGVGGEDGGGGDGSGGGGK